MKRRILRAVKITAAYILLNIGVLSWIQVSAATGNRLNPAETVMAEIHSDRDRETIEVSMIGKSVMFDYSFMDSEYVQTLVLGLGEPEALVLWDIFT